MRIGWIGQGWIGKNYADDFEARGYDTVRYALEEPYIQNKDKIASCDIVFIAVPTPTTPEGFDDSLIRGILPLMGAGKIAVIKSTILPGTTESIQKLFPNIFLLHSPEFLTESAAAHDTAHPNRNIIGIPVLNAIYREKAEEVLRVLPDAPYAKVMAAQDAEFVKYAGNCFLFTKIMFMNLLYDFVAASGSDWSNVREALIHDPRIGASHTEPVHTSGHATKGGRGAGGHCFIKDFEAFRELYRTEVHDIYGDALLTALKEKNIELLVNSSKDLDLLEDVYGDISRFRNSQKDSTLLSADTKESARVISRAT
ncbi:UDP-glucose/GDP-mannose dehydrogenase family protein [Candidatus Kaiserbacteria bacterium]|nr:UDP-glucose/GDP-mannose dehydrogenase family protein [Candidatus Kaiserbacteria bacterium]